MKLPNILNVQRFSIHDGDGIRTTVFFKGCPLACAWCHNPESQSFGLQLMFDREKCSGCGACVRECSGAALTLCQKAGVEVDWEQCRSFCADGEKPGCGFACVDSCITNARCVAGQQIPLNELVRQLLRDRAFYEQSGGGVTLSGGEVMVQDMEYLMSLLKQLHKEEISVNIDTCGEVSYERIKQVLPYTNTFLYDLKAASDTIHQCYTGRSNQRILENLERLSRDGARINLRIPVIAQVNDSEEEMDKMIAFIKKSVHVVQVNLLPYHRAGSDKWERLGMTGGEGFTPPSQERMKRLQDLWLDAGISPVYIGG